MITLIGADFLRVRYLWDGDLQLEDDPAETGLPLIRLLR
jgi:hypothetical protein